ncbi:hypothetical protein [Catellatospora citrea]|uniref:Parallel beta helix pectate lyase-like protein n=1 Tax=Catellatospora citrea TaxID=53366 RepID=A0A8J3KVK7_9ACTN|nr:hypothetical protein [Catellatospora citrea]RKE09669.1 hypothetical protein C8E86_4559 [Catellatospora citrea]GIG02710.1 hypothetical protein Cci01nite_78030 [Catellatospora citrea]
MASQRPRPVITLPRAIAVAALLVLSSGVALHASDDVKPTGSETTNEATSTQRPVEEGQQPGEAAPSASSSVTPSGTAKPKPGASSSKAPARSGNTLPQVPVVTVSGDYPSPATTGVPAGTKLNRLGLNFDGTTYRVTAHNTVLDAVHIPGDLLITANNVRVTRSQIDGMVYNEYARKFYPFTISDSTIGPTSYCHGQPGLGFSDYTATRVLLRGHSDGFRASGPNINIQDSYVHLCTNPGAHSDGIQTYLTGRGLTLNHTTIDQRDANPADVTAPVFIVDSQAEDVVVTNNLIMGGTYSIQVRNVKGTAIVQNNRLVDRSWIYAPVDSDCATISWSGNTIVTIDANYQVVNTVGPLPCKDW